MCMEDWLHSIYKEITSWVCDGVNDIFHWLLTVVFLTNPLSIADEHEKFLKTDDIGLSWAKGFMLESMETWKHASCFPQRFWVGP